MQLCSRQNMRVSVLTPCPSDSTIPRLLNEVRSGRSEAIGDLLEQFRGYLRILARLQVDQRLQSKLDASDIVQESLLMAHRDFHAFRGNTQRELIDWIRSILAHVTANTIRHYLGTQSRDIRLERSIARDLDQSQTTLVGLLASPDRSPSQIVQQREEVVRLTNALNELPETYREVVIQHHLQGNSLSQVASKLGRSVDSVQKLRARAVVRLAQLLK